MTKELQEIHQQNPLAIPPKASENMLATEHTKAAASVVAAIQAARNGPRDIHAAYQNILKSCERPGLASKAIYSFQRGGLVEGPSIRLVEVLAQCWGNMSFGTVQLSQNSRETVLETFAWDLETNTRSSRIVTVPHERHTRKGVQKLTDPRDIYEATANQGARRLRACILALIPPDIVEDAVMACKQTMRLGAGQNLEAKIREIVGAFGKLSVTQAHLEERLGHPVAEINIEEMLELSGICNAIKDGTAKRDNFFKIKVDVDKIPPKTKETT